MEQYVLQNVSWGKSPKGEKRQKRLRRYAASQEKTASRVLQEYVDILPDVEGAA